MVKARLSLMIFAQLLAQGTWFVPLGSYMSNGLGFSDIIGQTYGLLGVATVVSTLFIGMLADRYFPAEKVLAVLSIAAGLVLLWVSTITQSKWMFLFGCGLHFLFAAPTIPLATAIIFHGLRDPNREFPKVRVWGTIGWIVGGIVVGVISGAAETALPMRIAGVVLILLGLYSYTLPHTPPMAKGATASVGQLLGLDILREHRSKAFFIFAIAMFVLMVPKGFYDSFANSFFTDKGLHITAGETVFEATSIQTIGQLLEIFFILILPFVLIRVGVKWVLAIGMIGWGIRFLLFSYGYVDDHAITLFLIIGIALHGICYDFVFVASQIYVNERFGPAARARAQSFLALITQGIGTIIGANIAGMTYMHYSAGPMVHDWQKIWLVPAIISFLVLIWFVVAFRDNVVGSGAKQLQNG